MRAGGDLYALRTTAAQPPTTYPPFAALPFTPLTLLDTAGLRTLATAANLVLLVAFVRLSLRLVGHTRVESVWWVSALAVWCEPVWTTLRYGQVNLLLAVLVLWDLSRRSGDRTAGLGIGLATAIKLTPALFVAAFLLAAGLVARLRHGGGGPWLRHARGAALSFAGATLLAAAVLPYDSWQFCSRALFETGRVGHAEETTNQALRGRREWAVAACAVTALLVSPVSWSHHWVWCVPHGLGRPELHQGGIELMLSALYGAAGCAFLVLAGTSLGSPGRRQAVTNE
ncbi:glycosyltransferase 87 family protein [Streptomyces pseudovenezuelae]|uniref:Alpha-1,2-mannosyltransferase n=1 Tax=Streptomyces pseudovenezuelae TaxID=67350 RepID=A0ABT6LH57_9ACTN|nr:alpha-1,2-mannosyltransferase [Streptomyces pseudovenezuelae]